MKALKSVLYNSCLFFVSCILRFISYCVLLSIPAIGTIFIFVILLPLNLTPLFFITISLMIAFSGVAWFFGMIELGKYIVIKIDEKIKGV